MISNNLISNIGNSLGSIVGINVSSLAGPSAYMNIYHNTISIDDFTATASALSTGIQITSGTQCKIKNNIVTISRGGNGLKKCYEYGTVIGTGFQADYNVASNTAVAGVNYAVGAVGATYASFVALNNAVPFLLLDINSKDADPVYTNAAALNYVPTATVINNMCLPVGVLTDNAGLVRSLASPDPGAFETFTTPCTGTPGSNSITTVPVQCPNANVSLALVNNLPNSGYNVQWQSANVISGPYAPIAGANTPFYNTSTVTATTYYNALISCGSGPTITTLPGTIQVAGTTISNVPYVEDFESITRPNRLPNCSWSATSSYTSTLTYTTLASNNRIPHSGSKFASFYNAPAGVNAFYTNGINLVAGLTYSAGLYYINEQLNYNNWSDLSILVGTNQSAVGLVSIASTSASVVSYALLSGTFTVPSSGIYYIAVRATTGSGNSPYLTWDDLFVNIPCSLNSPTVTLNAPGSGTICSGDLLTLTSAGADTYTWNTAANGSAITVTPAINTLYTVTGTSTLSGCSSTLTKFITVNPSPQLYLSANNPTICQGQSVSINAQGATSYNWSTGGLTQLITVNPTVTTSYTANGSNSFGCTSSQSITITVNNKPSVVAGASQTLICKGEPLTFTATGATSYVWASASLYTVTATGIVNIIAQTSGAYSVTGTAANGCSANASVLVNVDICSGVTEFRNGQMDINVYPNPTTGEFFITSKQSSMKTVEIYDIAGKIIYSASVENGSKVNISDLANGGYSVKITTAENSVKYIKVVKTQ